MFVNQAKQCLKQLQFFGLHFNTFSRYAKKFKCYKHNQGGKGISRKKNINKTVDDILSGKRSNFQTFKLKQKLLLLGIKENKCEICGCVNWQGKPLKMELHHIDGNRTNHNLNNLQMLCPNCHSQTDNYTSKNKN